jgi:hypothetical protein
MLIVFPDFSTDFSRDSEKHNFPEKCREGIPHGNTQALYSPLPLHSERMDTHAPHLSSPLHKTASQRMERVVKLNAADLSEATVAVN